MTDYAVIVTYLETINNILGVKCCLTQKSRAKYLSAWRKKNPEKVKLHTKNASHNYYLKNAEQKKTTFIISYHKYAMTQGTPFQHYNPYLDKDVTVDNDIFDNNHYRPRLIWKFPVIINWTLKTKEEQIKIYKERIKTNIKYVLRLQKKKIIPVFLVYPLEWYLLNEHRSILYWDMLDILIKTSDEDKDKTWDELETKNHKEIIETINQNYENHIKKDH